MTASRISVESDAIHGDAIEIAGRFSSEAEIDAFIERVWTVFFALHPPTEEAESAAAPIEPPQPARKERFAPAVDAEFAVAPRADSPAIHDSAAQCLDVDARRKAGRDASSTPLRAADDVDHNQPSGPATADDAAAFARLSAGERRAVLLMRKHRDRSAVAKIMEINPNSVTNYISAARNKGVQI